MVTFQASSITGCWSVPIYTAWRTEAHVCEQLAHGHVNQSDQDSKLRPIGCKSNALTTTPHATSPSSIGLNRLDKHQD